MTLHVAPSPITHRIFAGSIRKDGVTWGSNKTDVTGEACAAVAHHALGQGGTITVTGNGKPLWEITVREVGPGAEPAAPDGNVASPPSHPIDAQVCRMCGCTDDDCSGCIQRTGQPCYWVEDDLCSACADRP